jgi:hypothetical protein
VIALRAKLLRAQSSKQLASAQRLAQDARDTVARAHMLERLHRTQGRRRRLIALVGRPSAQRA